MQTVGVYLKKGREAQNISLSDVSDYTKISKLYLDCLEKDEYSKIPAKPYVKGYISSYAAFIGIDENEALKLYDSVQNDTDDSEKIKPEILQNERKTIAPYFRFNKKFWLVIAFFILGVVSIAAYFSFFQNQTETATEISVEEPDKDLESEVNSTTKPESSQKSLDNNSYSSKNHAGLDEKKEKGEIVKNHDIDISQIPAPLTSQESERNSIEASNHQPIKEVSKVKDFPGSETDRIVVEDHLMPIEVTACTGIKNRIPQGIGNTFDWSTNRIYIWSRIKCKKPASSIRHIYYFNGEKVNDVLLKVRSPIWRTWSYKTVSNKRYIGHWRVDVTSFEGKILKSINFEIK